MNMPSRNTVVRTPHFLESNREILKMKFNIILLLLIITLIGCEQEQSNADNQRNTTIFHNGTIITMEGDSPQYVEAVVERDGKISFVGKLSDAQAKYPNAKEHNLNGNTMLPGLIDNHLHLGLGAFLLPLNWITPEDWTLVDGEKIEASESKEEFLANLQKLVDEFDPKDKIIEVFGYSQYFHGSIYKTDLDRISKDVPINLFHRSFHENIFNSAGLEYFGYTPENMDDPQADFDKGLVLESFQNLDFLYQRWLPKVSIDDWRTGLSQVSDLLLQNGITTIHGPGGFVGATQEQIDVTYQEFDEVAARSYFSLDIRPTYYEGGFEHSINEINKAYEMNTPHIVFQKNQIKLFIDGGMFGQQMMLTEPYTDGHHGEYLTEPDALYNMWKPFWERRIDAHIHVNGDLALDDLFEIVERLQEESPWDEHRTIFEHFGVSRPEQSKRIAELGINVSTNPYYAIALGENFTNTGVGPASRSHYFSRSGSLAKNNLPFSLHSDFPMAPPSPLYLMWSAVNRITPDGNVVGPEEKITAYQALKGVTLNAALSIQKENIIGSIAVGKIADFTILEENPLTIDPMKIKDIGVHSVIFEGTEFLANE